MTPPFEKFEVGSVIGGSNYIVRTEPKLDLSNVWLDCVMDREREEFIFDAIREKMEREKP